MGIFDVFTRKKSGNGVAFVAPPVNYANDTEADLSSREAKFKWFKEAYETVPLITAIINVKTDQVVQEFYFDGPNKNKLKKWSEEVNLRQVLYRITKNMLIYGNSYIEVVADRGGRIKKLKVLDSIWMNVYRSETGKIIGYSQIIDDKKLVLWGTTGTDSVDESFPRKVTSINQIAHFRYNVLGSEKYGRSTIEPLISSIVAKRGMERSLGLLLKKYVAPLIWAAVGTDEMPAQETAVTDVAGKLRDLHAESEIATSHLVKLTVLEFDKKGIDIKTPLGHIEDQIITGGQVPPVLLGRGEGADKTGSEVQLRNFGRHIKSIQREVKEEFEDNIIIKQGIGTSEDKLTWAKAEEREWESDIDILRGLVTDGIITPQKANDLLPPDYQEKLPDPITTVEPRPSQMVDKKVKGTPNDPTKSTTMVKGRRVTKTDKKVPIK